MKKEGFSSRLYKDIFENAAEGILGVDVVSKKIILANKVICKWLKYSKKEILGLKITDIHRKADLPKILKDFRKQLRGEITHAASVPVLRKDNKAIFCDIDSRSILKRDKKILVGFFKLSTDELQTEQSKEEELLKLKLGIQKSSDAIFITDKEGYFTYINPAFTRIYGYDLKEVIGKTPRILKSGQHNKKFYRDFWNKLLSGKSVMVEIVNKTKMEKLIAINVSANPIINSRKQITGFLAIQRDLTKQKETESKLNESEDRFRVISNLTSDFAYAFDVLKNGKLKSTWVSGAFKKITEYSKAELGKKGGWSKLIHPDDLKNANDQLKTLMSGKPANTEYRIITKRGKIKWMHDYAEPTLKEKSVKFIHGAVRDITKEKNVQLVMEKNEKKFQDIALISGDFVWEVNSEGKYTYASEGVEKILGYKPTEIIGKTPFDFMPKKEAIRVGRIFKKIVLKKDRIEDLENWNISKTDKRVLLLTNGIPILDESRTLKGYRGVDKDITLRKKAKNSLKKEKEFSEKLIDTAPGFIVGLNVNANIILFNKAAEKISGYTKEEVIGKNWFDIFIDKNINEKIKKVFSEVIKKKEIDHNYENEIITKNNEKKIISWHNTVLLNESGNVKNIISIGQDVTEKRKIQRKSEELRTELENRIQELEKFQKLTIGRELKMIELKNKIKRLEETKK